MCVCVCVCVGLATKSSPLVAKSTWGENKEAVSIYKYMLYVRIYTYKYMYVCMYIYMYA